MADELGAGFEAICGIKKEAAWGTVLAVDEAVPFLKESYVHEIEQHEDEVLRGKAGKGTSNTGNRKVAVTLPCNLTYEDLDLLIALHMGAAGTPEVNGALYDNTYSLVDMLPITNSCTIAIHKNVSVWEYAGCIPNVMKISGSANGPLEAEFDCPAKGLDLDSTPNTPAILAALSTEDAAAKVMMSDLEFKIAAQASALTGETEMGINSFEFVSNNNLAADQFDNRSTSILQPRRNGPREVTLNFGVPRYEADTYVDWYIARTALHAWLKFTSGNYLFDIHIPNLLISNAQIPVEGKGIFPQKIEAVCHRDPGSASASFTCTDEYEIDVTNGRTTSPLA